MNATSPAATFDTLRCTTHGAMTKGVKSYETYGTVATATRQATSDASRDVTINVTIEAIDTVTNDGL